MNGKAPEIRSHPGPNHLHARHTIDPSWGRLHFPAASAVVLDHGTEFWLMECEERAGKPPLDLAI